MVPLLDDPEDALGRTVGIHGHHLDDEGVESIAAGLARKLPGVMSHVIFRKTTRGVLRKRRRAVASQSSMRLSLDLPRRRVGGPGAAMLRSDLSAPAGAVPPLPG